MAKLYVQTLPPPNLNKNTEWFMYFGVWTTYIFILFFSWLLVLSFFGCCADMAWTIINLFHFATPLDVDKLRKIGVRTIFCLQQDPDIEYFGVDIGAIRQYAIACGDIEHIRAEIRDFDAFDLRMRLPVVVRKLYKAIKRNHGVTYVHCTAGLGRAPAVALAYMFWIEDYKLNEGHQLLQGRRACFPKLDAIKNATVDMFTKAVIATKEIDEVRSEWADCIQDHIF